MADTRPCPFCAEPVPVHATLCRWCREPLGGPGLSRDDEHLRLLSIFHYVDAALTAVFASFPLLHLLLGIFLVACPETFSGGKDKGGPPAFIGWIFIVIAGFVILAGWTLAILIFCAGRFLSARKHRTFCLVVAGLDCLKMPIGTVLGVFTIVVLTRPSVRGLFEAPPPAAR